MKYLLIFFQAFILFPLFGQVENFKFYQFPKLVPPQYITNIEEDFRKIMNEQYPSDIDIDDIKYFADMVAKGKHNLLLSGEVYLGFTEMEDYLNKILLKIYPDLNPNKVRVYLTRNPSYNAFAIHDGALFINIGLFANIRTEAELAFIIGHEFAHYVHKDVLNSFYTHAEQISKEDNSTENVERKIRFATFDRNQEKMADSLSCRLIANAGYDLNSAKNVFLTMLLEETKNNNDGSTKSINTGRVENSSLSDLLRTYPKTYERLSFVEKNSTRWNLAKSGSFIVDQKEFARLQEIAKIENLNNLLSFNQLEDCIENSLIYYLLQPSNNIFLYYLTESIRRQIYLDDEIKNVGFLSDHYKTFINSKQSVLHNLNLVIRDTSLYNQIQDKELLDTAGFEFETYEEAFNYFAKKSMDRGIKESYLSTALYSLTAGNIKKSDSLLGIYLNFDDAKYRKYAKAITNKELDKTNFTRELIFMPKISKYLCYVDKNKVIEKTNNTSNDKIISCLDANFKQLFPKTRIKYSPHEIETDMDEQIKISQMLYTLYKVNNYLEDEKKDIEPSNIVFYETVEDQKEKKKEKEMSCFVYNPELWNQFNEMEIKSLSFTKISSVKFHQKVSFANVAAGALLLALAPYYILYSPMFISANQGYSVDSYKFSPFQNKIKSQHLETEIDYEKATPLNIANTIYYQHKEFEKINK